MHRAAKTTNNHVSFNPQHAGLQLTGVMAGTACMYAVLLASTTQCAYLLLLLCCPELLVCCYSGVEQEACTHHWRAAVHAGVAPVQVSARTCDASSS
jgi:hypothetical protein